jgi:aromatic-L-amino-acid/L-tryptophan decarboxylase
LADSYSQAGSAETALKRSGDKRIVGEHNVKRRVVRWFAQLLDWPDGGDAAEPAWFSEYGLEQTRPFRALKVWMQLAHLGRRGYRRLIARDIAGADTLRRQLDDSNDFEVLAHGLSVVCFRHRPAGMADGELDQHNRSLLRGLQARGGAFLAGTQVDERFALHACIVNPLTIVGDVTAILAEARRRAS